MQVYLKADRNVISSLQMLSTEAEVTDSMLANLASFVCAAYSPKGIYIYTISELRWYLFCKHMAKSGPWSLETTCPEIPYKSGPSQSVRTGKHCSAGASVGFPAKWLPQGVRWPAETNHDRYPSSSKGHHSAG